MYSETSEAVQNNESMLAQTIRLLYQHNQPQITAQMQSAKISIKCSMTFYMILAGDANP